MSFFDRFKSGGGDATDELTHKVMPPVTDELAQKMTPPTTDEPAQKVTPVATDALAQDELAQKVEPASTDNLAFKMTRPLTDELAQKIVPPITDELAQKVIPPATDELAQKVTVPITDELALKMTSPVTDELVGASRDGIAFRASMTIHGSKQGTFKGESASARPTKGQLTSQIAIRSFSYEVTSARDPRTGQASGNRQHQPVTVVKELGAASPQLFQALVTNEALTDVVFEFYRMTPAGQEELHFTIIGVKGAVANYKLYTGETKRASSSAANRLVAFMGTSEAAELEEVSFTFQTIQMEHTASATTAVDDWAT
jgi:type VI secretion system secreted protein Hcp